MGACPWVAVADVAGMTDGGGCVDAAGAASAGRAAAATAEVMAWLSWSAVKVWSTWVRAEGERWMALNAEAPAVGGFKACVLS